MALGVKVKNLKFEKAYSTESLFEAIKDKTFTAGQPSLTKNGFANVITFPALDSQNQVWVLKNGFGAESQKFSVQKQQQAGVSNIVLNSALDKVTGGAFGVASIIGSNVKKCEELVEITAKELAEMEL